MRQATDKSWGVRSAMGLLSLTIAVIAAPVSPVLAAPLSWASLSLESTSGDSPAAASAARNSYVVGSCHSTDDPSPEPHWHLRAQFQSASGQPTTSIRPGGVARFVARVASGNLDGFNMEALTTAPMYHFPKAMEVLERGSHPAWAKSGGNPHWSIKNLCHWRDKRTIRFLVKVDAQAKAGSRLCMPFDVWGRTGGNVEPYEPGVLRRCLKVTAGRSPRVAGRPVSGSVGVSPGQLPAGAHQQTGDGQLPGRMGWSGQQVGRGALTPISAVRPAESFH